MLNEFQFLQPEEFEIFLNSDNDSMKKQDDALDVDLVNSYRQPFHTKDHASEGTIFDFVEQGFNLKTTKINNATSFANREAALADMSLRPRSPEREKISALPAALQFSLGSERELPREKLLTEESKELHRDKANDKFKPKDVAKSSETSAAISARSSDHNVKTTPDESFSFYKGPVRQYTKEERQRVLRRYREKRSRRVFKKKVRYECRRKFAMKRPRIGGRFVKIQK